MSIEKTPSEVARELAAWLDATEASPQEDRYIADAKGNSYRLPPPGLSARQRLDWANTHAAPAGRTAEAAVTPGEIGMSTADFEKLSPARKLELANAALARRHADQTKSAL